MVMMILTMAHKHKFEGVEERKDTLLMCLGAPVFKIFSKFRVEAKPVDEIIKFLITTYDKRMSSKQAQGAFLIRKRKLSDESRCFEIELVKLYETGYAEKSEERLYLSIRGWYTKRQHHNRGAKMQI
ncbi:hypothetical protein RF11_01363 [Thelohanellus kitauei]|uniref:Uncharacterized protein n=1 Tax=Thelohanellus kitauei TaxID=669202 RepID=A0A0C2J1S2_THEKT|nr:hypothetical protein RF11_01363 [Thelohanellus kitauei]